MVKGRVSVILPSRNEVYLSKTIQDLLVKAVGDIEIIAVLDGYWEEAEKIVDDPRVNYLNFGAPRGMRNAINKGVAVATGEFIMKLDAHCMVAKGFDKDLKEVHEPNWIQIPRRYALDPEAWALEDRTDRKYPIDVMALSSTLQGTEWHEGSNPNELIEDTPMSQGSCWFMHKNYYEEIGLLDEKQWGLFFWEFLEIALKCWGSGGSVKVNKGTWYAHYHKTKSRGYSLPSGERERADKIIKEMSKEIDIIRKKFPNMPK